MKSLKVIMRSRLDCLPLVFEEIESRNVMRWKYLAKVIEISKKVF